MSKRAAVMNVNTEHSGETHEPSLVDQEKIRARAHELWTERGCPEGSAHQDWFEAEAEILSGKKQVKRQASSF